MLSSWRRRPRDVFGALARRVAPPASTPGDRLRGFACAAALLAIIVLGAGLRGHGLGERPLWEDESYTWQDSSTSYLTMLAWKHDPRHGPVSFLLTRISRDVLGVDSAWSLRLPSFLAGVLCIPAAYWLGRRASNRGLGLGAALLVACDPNQVDQSQQARMYTMLALAQLMVWIQALPLLRAPARERRPWIHLGLLLSLTMYIHFSAAVIWLSLGATLACLAIAWDLPRRRETAPGPSEHRPAFEPGEGLSPQASHRPAEFARRASQALASFPYTRGMLIAYGVAAACSSRALWKLFKFYTDGHEQTSPRLTPVDNLRAIAAELRMLHGAGDFTPLVWIVALVGLALLWRKRRQAAMLVGVSGVVGLLGVYNGQSVHRIAALRYLTILQPPLWLALAAPWAIGRRFSSHALGAGALAAIVAWQSAQSRDCESWNDLSAWRFVRRASEMVRDESTGNQIVYCAPYGPYRILANYYQVAFADARACSDPAKRGERAAENRGPQDCYLIAEIFNDEACGHALAFLRSYRDQAGAGLDVEQTLARLRGEQRVVLRVRDGSLDCWVYDQARDALRPAERVAVRSDIRMDSGILRR